MLDITSEVPFDGPVGGVAVGAVAAGRAPPRLGSPFILKSQSQLCTE